MKHSKQSSGRCFCGHVLLYCLLVQTVMISCADSPFSDDAAQLKSLAQQVNNRVFQGTPVTSSLVSRYVVSLRNENNRHVCGGAILNKRWIITSASCVVSRGLTKTVIIAGSKRLNQGGAGFGLAKIVTFPGYRPITGEHDIALVQVNRDIQFGDNIGKVVVSKQRPSSGEATVIGWGATNDNDQQSILLRSNILKVISNDVCAKSLSQINDRILCTSDYGQRKGPCIGDYGGPLVVNNQLVGLALKNGLSKCAQGVDKFASVANYYDFIQRTAGI